MKTATQYVDLAAIKEALVRHDGDKRAAAAELGIGLKNLCARLPRHGGADALLGKKPPKRKQLFQRDPNKVVIDLDGIPQLPDSVAGKIAAASDRSLSDADQVEASRAIAAATSVIKERRLAEMRSRTR